MKPRNSFQRRVVEAMPLLRPLTPAQKKWGYNHSLYKYACRTPKGTTTCLECGHKFKTRNGLKQCICPHCGRRLKVEETHRRKTMRDGYFCIVTTCKGLQVIRYFYIRSYCKKGEPSSNYYYEVIQRWIDEKGNTATTAMPRVAFSFNIDTWQLSGKLELRRGCVAHKYIKGCFIYPSVSIIPSLRRNGFHGQYHTIAPASLFEALLKSPMIETLFKAGWFELVKHFISSDLKQAEQLWPAIKIALRRGYKIDNPTLWCDYIKFLIHFGKDIRNASYVCPDNLQSEHDRWARKKHKADTERWERERREWEIRYNERIIKKAAEQEEQFRKLKSKFFGIQFDDGYIAVRVLESVEEYRQEGEHMHHCVFTGEYYLKPDSLVLSAMIDGKRVETIEVSLSTLEILQCYGACNKFTEHHDRIVELVNRNIHLIGQRLSA